MKNITPPRLCKYLKKNRLFSFGRFLMLFFLGMNFYHVQGQTLNLLLSTDTLEVHDTLTITNASTGFLQTDTFYLELEQPVEVNGMYQLVKNVYLSTVNEAKYITYSYPGRYLIKLFKSGQSISRQVWVIESYDTFNNVADSGYFCSNQIYNSFNPINNINSSNSLTQIAPFVYGCRVLNWSTGDTTGTSAGNEATLMRLLHDNDSLLADSLSAWWMGQSALYKLVIRQEEEISNPQLALFKQTWDTTVSAQLALWEKWMAEMTDSLPEFNWQALQPTQSSDEHHKLVLQVYNQWLRTDSLAQEQAVISLHAQALENVARLCPYEEGDAVYMARNLLRILYPDTLFTDTCEVFWLPIYNAKVSANSPISNQQPCYMQVYPVPANHEITLDVACMLDEVEGIVKIWTLDGRLVHQQLVNNSMTRLSLPVTAWKQGLYLYELFINEEKVYYGKFEVLH